MLLLNYSLQGSTSMLNKNNNKWTFHLLYLKPGLQSPRPPCCLTRGQSHSQNHSIPCPLRVTVSSKMVDAADRMLLSVVSLFLLIPSKMVRYRLKFVNSVSKFV